jgi:hypothetical protein
MRILAITTAAVAAAIGLAGCGARTLTDSRDGQKYRTMIMPDGKRWMAKNLNYRMDSSWCYENNADRSANNNNILPKKTEILVKGVRYARFFITPKLIKREGIMKSIPGERKPIVTRGTWREKVLPVFTATLMLMLIVIIVEAVK